MIVYQVMRDGCSDDESFPVLYANKEKAIEAAKARYPGLSWTEKVFSSKEIWFRAELVQDGYKHLANMIVRTLRVIE